MAVEAKEGEAGEAGESGEAGAAAAGKPKISEIGIKKAPLQRVDAVALCKEADN